MSVVGTPAEPEGTGTAGPPGAGTGAHRVPSTWRRPLAFAARNFTVQVKATPYIWVSGLVEPFLYLLSIGLGLGHLVGTLPGPNGRPVAYASFVAPGLLATSAMNGAIAESTVNIFAKLHWSKLYHSVVATPLAPADIALAEIGFAVARCTLYGAAFLGAMAAFGETGSWLAILDIPVAALIGAAFASSGFAAACYMRSWTDFDKIHLVSMPLFLFSAVFYPLSTLPHWLADVVRVLPLYPGVVLCRQLALGQPTSGAALDVVYLVALTALATAVGRRRVSGLLAP